MLRQCTLRSRVQCSGVGLHSGAPVTLCISPGRENSGYVFVRTDLARPVEIPARPEFVVDVQLATTLGKDGATVGTVEHVLAALAGVGIDNARIEVNGPEVPILDGSAAPFVALFRAAGLVPQRRPKKLMLIRRAVEVQEGEKSARLSPASRFSISCSIDFQHPLVTNQRIRMDFTDRFFEREIARARTFGFVKDVHRMRSAGRALGGSLDNAVVVDEFHILNREGLRFPDEFVRHKVLDAMGDLALLGMPVLGAYNGRKSGHALNLALVKKLARTPRAFEVLEIKERDELEGEGLRLPAWGLPDVLPA